MEVTQADLLALARAWRMNIDGEAEYVALCNEILSGLAPLADVLAPAQAPQNRTFTGRLSRDEDPYNALVRRCDVPGVGAGILSGKSVALKDSISIAGIPLSCGSGILQDFVPSRDAVVTERILAAGGRIAAVTNMDDLAFSGGGETSFYGPVRNPRDPARAAGGSSGGSAASLYYREIDVALGTDQGGSIRLPASWCGVIGLKPTHGLVPYSGIVAIDQTIDHVGPLGRTVTDVAALLTAIAGYHPSDARQTNDVRGDDYLSYVNQLPPDLGGIRIALVTEAFADEVGVEPATAAAVRTAAGQLERLGADLVERSVPEHLEAGAISYGIAFEGLSALLRSGGNGYQWAGEYWPELSEAIRTGLQQRASDLSAPVKLALLVGSYLQGEYYGAVYARAQAARTAVTAAYGSALESVDCLLMPTAPRRAQPIDETASLREHVLRGWEVLANTTPTDITGHPAISLPVGMVDGLPVGAMMIGPKFGEARLLTIAGVYEREFGWPS